MIDNIRIKHKYKVKNINLDSMEMKTDKEGLISFFDTIDKKNKKNLDDKQKIQWLLDNNYIKKNGEIYINTTTGKEFIYYGYFYKKVLFAYFPNSEFFAISGRLFYLYDNKNITSDEMEYLNFDDIENFDIADFIKNINKYLKNFINDKIDIRNWTVTRADVCFNLFQDTDLKGIQPQKYIDYFNSCCYSDKFSSKVINASLYATDERYRKKIDRMYGFNKNNNWKEWDKTSCYMRTKKDFEKAQKNRYSINFYNKGVQLLKRFERDFFDEKILNHKILRLEVQLYHRIFCERYKENRTFKDVFNIDFCIAVIEKYINDFFPGDYLSYKEIKQQNNIKLTTRDIENLKTMQINKSKNRLLINKTPTATINKLKSNGICPYMLVSSKTRHLKNPLILINEKIEKRKENLRLTT